VTFSGQPRHNTRAGLDFSEIIWVARHAYWVSLLYYLASCAIEHLTDGGCFEPELLGRNVVHRRPFSDVGSLDGKPQSSDLGGRVKVGFVLLCRSG
jgi:hypothetical protein